jgi:hypothetical protein
MSRKPMSVDLQILQGLFLNKEREKWWKTISLFYSTQEDKETAQWHSSKINLEKEHDTGNLHDDLLLFDGEINRFLLNSIRWVHEILFFLYRTP